MGALVRLAGKVRTRIALPLLAKELTETAARRRTFVLRGIYAVVLYSVAALLLPAQVWTGENEMYYGMGRGGYLLDLLIWLQFWGVALLLPALMCGRITQEKERDSLVLLFLTRLGPWSIILQKYAGGLALMGSLLLLGLPLAGVAYSFGGVDSAQLLFQSAGVFVLCLQIGALALACSAWCRTTVGAFLMTYFFLSLFYWGPIPLLNPIEAVLDMAPQIGLGWLLVLAPSVLSIPVFLCLARLFLVRRAFLPPSDLFRRLFTRIDSIMKRLNQVTGGIVFYHGSSDLPADEPVFWRETHRRLLGKANYLIRVLYAVEAPTLLLCLFIVNDGGFQQFYRLSALFAVLSILATLFVSVHAANTVVSERVDQTLDVLLTTPLSARDIIRQKGRALRRLLIIVATPLLTVLICESAAESGFRPKEIGTWLPYLTCGALLVTIYLPLVTWLSLWISLRVRTRFQAGIITVCVFTFWTALAPVLFFLVARFFHGEGDIASPWSLIVLLSPASLGYLNETGALQDYFQFLPPWLVITTNSALYAWLAFFFRQRVLGGAEKLLRR